MARPPEELVAAAKPFVCVRVTDMRKVDLARFRVDFGLTFSALTADPDGNVRHRYGGRSPRDPQSALSMASLVAFLEGSLAAVATPAPIARTGLPRTIEAIPAFRERDAERRKAEKRNDCVHCHTIDDFEYKQAVADGAWRREQMWVFPDLARLGFEVERDAQQQVARVEPGSPAAKAGLAAGDRIATLNDVPILTRADLQWELHHLPFTKTTATLAFERAGARQTAKLELAEGWKACDPLEYAWRPYKWNVPPHPGFGGKVLDAQAKKALGLAPDAFAQQINYIVDWGDKAHTGRNAQKAGLRKGDVVLSIAGKDDFVSEDHVHAWFRITRKIGEKIEIVVLRDGERRTLEMKVID